MFTSSTFGLNQNTTTSLFNPVDQASANISLTQNLLNGFGLAVNKRSLHVAKNNLRASDLQFKEQVISTVSNVVNLYWDLVSFNDDLKIKRQTLELDTKLYEDNKRRAELGSIAPIDTIQAEAEMKAAEQDVVTEDTQVLQQELILKSVITRSGFDNTALITARIIPTDHIEMPAQDPVIPLQDLVAAAMRNRPEVVVNQISLENARLNMLGTKNNLLPTLSANVTLSNSGQAGAVGNALVPIDPNNPALGYVPITAANVNNFLPWRLWHRIAPDLLPQFPQLQRAGQPHHSAAQPRRPSRLDHRRAELPAIGNSGQTASQQHQAERHQRLHQPASSPGRLRNLCSRAQIAG